jgi:hypothetical protein
MKRAQVTSILIVALMHCSVGYGSGAEMKEMTSMIDPSYELPEDCDFMAAANNSTTRYGCSPRLQDSYFEPFIGLLVNGPAKVTWPSNASEEGTRAGPDGQTTGPLRLMISGVVQLPFDSMDLNGEFADKVLVVAVDRVTAKTYSGRIWFPESLPEPEPENADDLFPEPEAEKSADLKAPVANYFNIDLVHNLGIPLSNASYVVYATLGEYKSNSLMITTAVE